MPYYHASLLYLEPGAVIAPGAWGCRIYATGVRHSLYFRERELERTRQLVANSLPSRLSCSYAFSEMEYAVSFAANNAAQQNVPFLLYEVDVPAEIPTACLPMAYLDGWWQLCTPAEIESWTSDYWRAAPYEGLDAEVLVPGPLSVSRLAERLKPPSW